MEWLHDIIGEGKDMTIWQLILRTAIVFIITMILIRVGGVRIFGKRSGFDIVIIITMGAVLARGITGASPFIWTIVSAFTMIAIHRLLSWITYKSEFLEGLIKGSTPYSTTMARSSIKILKRFSSRSVTCSRACVWKRG